MPVSNLWKVYRARAFAQASLASGRLPAGIPALEHPSNGPADTSSFSVRIRSPQRSAGTLREDCAVILLNTLYWPQAMPAPPRRTASLLKLSSGITCGLEQEPSPPLSLIDPDLDEACARHIGVLIAKPMHLPQICGELLVVVTELGEHIHRRDEIGIIVEHALQAADVAD